MYLDSSNEIIQRIGARILQAHLWVFFVPKLVYFVFRFFCHFSNLIENSHWFLLKSDIFFVPKFADKKWDKKYPILILDKFHT